MYSLTGYLHTNAYNLVHGRNVRSLYVSIGDYLSNRTLNYVER